MADTQTVVMTVLINVTVPKGTDVDSMYIEFNEVAFHNKDGRIYGAVIDDHSTLESELDPTNEDD